MSKTIGSTGQDCICCGRVWVMYPGSICAECEKHNAAKDVLIAELSFTLEALYRESAAYVHERHDWNETSEVILDGLLAAQNRAYALLLRLKEVHE